MPGGKIVYGEKPAPGALKSEEVQLDTRPLTPGNPVGSDWRDTVPQVDSNRAVRQDKAAADVQQAQQQLDRAQEALRNSEEPLPGERIGIANGNSRLTDAYFERQKQLKANVQSAQAALDAAQKRASEIR